MATARRVPPRTCPASFRAACRTAKMGGMDGYSSAGRDLAVHLPRLAPDSVEDADWREMIAARLLPAILGRDEAAVLAWLDQNAPLCMALVPPRRRAQFVAGLFRAVIDDEVDITVD